MKLVACCAMVGNGDRAFAGCGESTRYWDVSLRESAYDIASWDREACKVAKRCLLRAFFIWRYKKRKTARCGRDFTVSRPTAKHNQTIADNHGRQVAYPVCCGDVATRVRR